MITHALTHSGFVQRTLPLLKIVFGSILLALSAKLCVPLWFTPVPVTMQTAALLGLGVFLGPRLAFASALLYLLEGAAGLPVFATASSSILVLVGPTAGYLWAFPFAAYLVGVLVRKAHHPLEVLVSVALSNFVILLAGTAWLAFSLGWTTAFTLGLSPFIPGALFKTALLFSLIYLTKAGNSYFTKK